MIWINPVAPEDASRVWLVYKKNISTAASYLVDSVSDYCFRTPDVYMKFVLGWLEVGPGDHEESPINPAK